MSRISFPGLRRKYLRPALAGAPAKQPDKIHFIDRAVYVIGISGFIMTVPQITKIWVEQNASGVSIISWCAYLLSASTWVVYGIIHRLPQMIILYSVWMLLEVIIIIGIAKYN